MKKKQCSWSFVLAAILTASSAQAADFPPAPDYPLSAVEKLYDDLSKQPEAERAGKILEGAKKEGKLEMIQAFGGTLGRNFTKIYRDTYPFVDVAETFLGTDDATSRIVAEEQAGRHLTDLLSSGGIPEINGLIDFKIAARIKTPATDRVLAQYRGFFDPHGRGRLPQVAGVHVEEQAAADEWLFNAHVDDAGRRSRGAGGELHL